MRRMGATISARWARSRLGLRTVLRASDDGFLGELHARGLRPHDARALRLFGRDGAPGASESFDCERDVLLVVAAPGGRVVDGEPPASALVVEVKRATPRPDAQLELPPPLAEPRLDLRIDRASALAYEVKEGEFIQIIDVEGKQCSDFLAFHEHKLQRGLERGIDGVTTRTLMGAAVPAPACTASSTTSTWTRSSRSCATRWAATTCSASPATRSTTRTWAIPAT